MATNKKGIGKGMAALIPNPSEQKEEPESRTDEQIAGNAVGQVAMIVTESLAGLDDHIAERMLRMIISMCQSELKGGH